MPRMIVRAAVSLALAVLMGTVAVADDAYAPPAKPAPKESNPGEPFVNRPLEPNGGQPAAGLQLTLIADKQILAERPDAAGRPLIVEQTRLHLIFKNAGGRPIILDTYSIGRAHLRLIVVGPEKDTVSVMRRPLEFAQRRPTPVDYPQIEPGNTCAILEPLTFPGNFNGLFTYGLYKPGNYKVQVVYSAGAPEGDMGTGAWRGTVASNALPIRIIGPPAPELPKEKPAEKPLEKPEEKPVELPSAPPAPNPYAAPPVPQ